MVSHNKSIEEMRRAIRGLDVKKTRGNMQKSDKMQNMSRIANFEYFMGYVREFNERCYRSNNAAVNGPTEEYITRVIRVLRESEDDVNKHMKCVEYCPCGDKMSLQEEDFYADVLSYPGIVLFCSLPCVKTHMKPLFDSELDYSSINTTTRSARASTIRRI
jgi:hypothetical protein